MIRGPKMAETIVAHPATFPRNRRPVGKTPYAATLGVIIGNREFFPDQLVAEARDDILKLFGACNVRPIMMSADDSKLGGVETHLDARKCAQLFKENRDEISGIVVVLPNFGDEKGVADAIKLAGLNVPVLIQAY